MLRVRVLGTFSLEEDGRTVALPRGRARQLLAYLALHPGRHPRATVAAALWPETFPDVALHRLRTTVWDVRKALPAVATLVLEVGDADLGLHPAVDVDLLQARALLEAGVGEAALELLEPGIAEEIDLEWAEQGRREVEAWRLQALERLVQETGEVRVALAYAQQRLALAPLSEVAHNDVIRLLLASGDRSGAMAAYERMRQILDVELGVRPSARSRRLLSEMNDDEPHPIRGSRAPTARGPAARPRVPYATTPLIGRDADLAELDLVLPLTVSFPWWARRGWASHGSLWPSSGCTPSAAFRWWSPSWPRRGALRRATTSSPRRSTSTPVPLER